MFYENALSFEIDDVCGAAAHFGKCRIQIFVRANLCTRLKWTSKSGFFFSFFSHT